MKFNYKDYPLGLQNPINPTWLCISKRWVAEYKPPMFGGRPKAGNTGRNNIKKLVIKMPSGEIREFDSRREFAEAIKYDVNGIYSIVSKAKRGTGIMNMNGEIYEYISG